MACKKGIKKCVVKETLTFDDYKNCLLANLGDVYRLQLMFRSTKHEVHTIEVNRAMMISELQRKMGFPR